MNTEKIERMIRRHIRDFDGVFSVDRLPSKPHLLVCNTDPSHRPGEHWVAIYVDFTCYLSFSIISSEKMLMSPSEPSPHLRLSLVPVLNRIPHLTSRVTFYQLVLCSDIRDLYLTP